MTGDRRSEWQVGRSISVGHIITTVALVVGSFTFIYDLREQIAVANFKIEAVEERFERMESRTNQQFDKIMGHLSRLENKMDRYFSKSIEQKGG